MIFKKWQFGSDWTKKWLDQHLRSMTAKQLGVVKSFILDRSGFNLEKFIQEQFDVQTGIGGEIDIYRIECLLGGGFRLDWNSLVANDEVDLITQQIRVAKKRELITIIHRLVKLMHDRFSIENQREYQLRFENFFKPALVAAGYWTLIQPFLEFPKGIKMPRNFQQLKQMALFAEFPHNPSGKIPLSVRDKKGKFLSKPCKSCKGRKATTKCFHCNGKGKLSVSGDTISLDYSYACEDCKGTGRGKKRNCPDCAGNGRMLIRPIMAVCYGCIGKSGKKKCSLCYSRGFGWTDRLPLGA